MCKSMFHRESPRQETNKALAREREIAEQVLARASDIARQAAEEQARIDDEQKDMLQLAGLTAQAGFYIEKWMQGRSYMPWEPHGLTLDLSTACSYAEIDGFRVTLRKTYILTDGSITMAPRYTQINRL